MTVPTSVRFLPRHSTISQLCFLVHKWQMALDKGKMVQSAFLNLTKAYNRGRVLIDALLQVI